MARPHGGTGTNADKIPAKHWKLTMIASIASYLDSGVIVGLGLSLGIWAEHYALSPLVLGSLSAVLTLCIAFGSLVGGRAADLVGRKRVFRLALLSYAAGVLLVIFATGPTTVFVGVVLAGTAGGANLPTSLAMVSEQAPEHARGRLVGFTQVMWVVGIGATQMVGFAVSAMGFLGTQIVFGHLAVVAVAAWVASSMLPAQAAKPTPEFAPTGERARGQELRQLATKPVLVPLLTIGSFYVAWNLGANTMGQFGVYLLTTVSGASQTLATGISAAAVPVGVALSLLFVRLADTPWRDRLFYVATVLQVAAFGIAAGAGAALVAMIVMMLLYNASTQFAGEGSYKVWSQQAFPEQLRASAQGLTYAISRVTVALAGLVTPVVLEWSSTGLLWMITGTMLASSLVGVYIVRRVAPQGGQPTEGPEPKSVPTAPAPAADS